MDNDSVGWFNARDYQEPSQPDGYPAGRADGNDKDDPYRDYMAEFHPAGSEATGARQKGS